MIDGAGGACQIGYVVEDFLRPLVMDGRLYKEGATQRALKVRDYNFVCASLVHHQLVNNVFALGHILIFVGF